jgi:arylsulfatase A-like enzyme
MDSLRADRLRLYTPAARPESPNLTELAKTSTVFRRAYTQANDSRAAYASMWTSLYPGAHGVLRDGTHLEDRWVTLGEAMKATGFATSGVTANGVLVAAGGFVDGWDTFKNHARDGGGVRGEDVLRDGLGLVDKAAKSPFFLFLGTDDTHVPWRAHDPWIARMDGKYVGRWDVDITGRDVEQISAGKLRITDREMDHVLALYDSDVSYGDDLVSRVLAKLSAWGVAEDTMLVITADHGEELWDEGGKVGHGASLREAEVRVPLIVHYPPLFPPGVVESPVDASVDLLPTLLDAVGMNPPEDAQGASLLPLAVGGGVGEYPRPAIMSQHEVGHAMRLGPWKLRVPPSGPPALYQVEEDPDEKKDLAATRPYERRFVTDALSTFLVYEREWRKLRWGVASNVSPQMAGDLER